LSLQSQIYDSDLIGSINVNGKVKELWNKDALDNAIKLWIISSNGELYRNPKKGGYVVPYLSKPMSDDTRDMITFQIKRGLEEDFVPYFIVSTVDVKPNYENKRWDIYIEGYSPNYKEFTQLNISIKNLV